MSNNSIWPIDKTQSGATTLGLTWPGSDGNEAVLYISQSSNITAASPSDCLVSYAGHSFWWGDLIPLQRCSRFILQPQPTGLYRHRKWTWATEFKSWTRMIAFHIVLIPLGKVWIQQFSLQLWVNSWEEWIHKPLHGKRSRRKTLNSNLLK